MFPIPRWGTRGCSSEAGGKRRSPSTKSRIGRGRSRTKFFAGCRNDFRGFTNKIMERALNMILPVFALFGDRVMRTMRALGIWCLFVSDILVWTFKPPFRVKQFFLQFEFVGVKSGWIIALTAF